MPNSRLANRASFFAEVDLLCTGEVMPQRYWSENLSEEGIFVQTTRPFSHGDRVSLRFDVDSQEVHVRAAQVVWVKPFEPINVDGSLPGVGLRFVSVDPPARAAIRRYVNALLKPADTDVPAPPPEPELSLDEGYVSMAPLRPLSLPPFDSNPPIDAAMPAPTLSEPPAPARRAALSAPPAPAPRPVTVAPKRASTPPAIEARADSLPPEESMSFDSLQPGSVPPEAMSFDALLRDSLPPQALPPDGAITQPDHPAEPRAIPSLEPMSLEGFDSEPPAPTFGHGENIDHDEDLAHGEGIDDGGDLDDGEDFEHPLAGWSFRIERPDPLAVAAEQDDALPVSATSETTPHAEQPEASEETRWSFASEPPGPAGFSLPPGLDDDVNDTLPPDQVGPYFSFDDEPPVVQASAPLSPGLDVVNERIDDAPPGRVIQPRSDLPSTAAESAQLDAAFFDGKLSVMDLPQSEMRGTNVVVARRNRGAWAAGLLVAGAALGAFIGYQSPADEAPDALAATEPVAEAAPQPRAVADAEAALFEAVAQPAPVVAATAPPPSAAPAPSEPVAAPTPEPAALTNVVATAAAPAPVAAAQSPDGVVAEYGRVTLPLVGGTVDRSFALVDPARVVVDLVDADFPGHKTIEVGAKGITRIRFGQPDPSHVRVVIELTGSKEPSGISTLKRGKTLAAAWR